MGESLAHQVQTMEELVNDAHYNSDFGSDTNRGSDSDHSERSFSPSSAYSSSDSSSISENNPSSSVGENLE